MNNNNENSALNKPAVISWVKIGGRSKEWYENRIKELRAKILFTYMLETKPTADAEY